MCLKNGLSTERLQLITSFSLTHKKYKKLRPLKAPLFLLSQKDKMTTVLPTIQAKIDAMTDEQKQHWIDLWMFGDGALPINLKKYGKKYGNRDYVSFHWYLVDKITDDEPMVGSNHLLKTGAWRYNLLTKARELLKAVDCKYLMSIAVTDADGDDTRHIIVIDMLYDDSSHISQLYHQYMEKLNELD